jgi:Cu/Ag efflux pump CusA
LVDLSIEPQIEIPQIQIKAKREILNQYGITIEKFNEFIDVALAGEHVSDIYEGNKTFALVVRFDNNYRGNLEKIKNTLIDAYDNNNATFKIPLHLVADIVSTTGPNTINRENVQRKTVVSANVAGRDIKSVVNDIKNLVGEKIVLPEGYRVEYGGQFEAESEASQVLFTASMFSILIIFFLLFQEFKNIKLAVIILINLPLALIGGVYSIYFTSGIMSIPSIIGFITLFGIATRNGILLISRYQTLTKEGKTPLETIMQGSIERLSPILMTALTAGLALIPLAISGDLPGNEIQSPMAKVILGGLLTSTILNLLIVPLVYYLTQSKNSRT